MNPSDIRTQLVLAARGLWSDRATGGLPIDMRLVRLSAGLFWIIAALTLVLLLAVAPPVQRLGVAGWAIGALAVAGCLVMAFLRLSSDRRPSMTQILVVGYFALLGLAGLEWLAGGRASPYHYLYVLPLLFVPAVHSPRRVMVFLVSLTVVACLPLAYQGASLALAGDIAVQLVMLLAVAGVIRLLFVVLRTQRAALHDALKRAEAAARRDPLTGLGNRLAFEETVDLEVARARRTGDPLSVIVADMDNFKRVNDELGHLAGDELLRQVADCLRAAARRSDESFRWGGDEFVVLLPRTTATQARAVSMRIRESVASASLADAALKLEVTCAAAELRPKQTAAQLLATADEILNAVKLHRGGHDGPARAPVDPAEREPVPSPTPEA